MMLLQHAEGEKVDIGGMVMHHAADANSLDFDPFFKIDLPRWEPIHLGPLTLDISPTKHVVFMLLAAVLVFLVMKLAAIGLEKQRKTGKAPRGFAGVIEGAVLWVRNDIAIANIGHGGEKFAPLIMTLFFFILFANLLGMLPWGASPTANLAVTAGLAVIVFLVIEIAGARKLGFKGYMGTIFPHFPGLHGPGAVVLSVVMSPIEIMGKLVKPFALAVRLFGNMTAGHFVVLSLFGIIFLFGHLAGANWGIGLTTAALVTGIMMLELIVAFLQAYVFALLSAVFIGLMQHEH
ncbi:MAG: F0F1 ATP synthase subunit A [Gemmatimonadales bacterium]